MTPTLTAFPASEPVVYAGRDEWLALRSTGIGGSDIPAILGMSRWDSPRDVWMDKTGRSEPRPDTWRMARGHALEGPLLDWFAAETGRAHLPVPMQRNRDRPWMLGTPDALADDGGIVECKTTSWWMRDEWVDGAADYAVLQGQWYLAVTGATRLWVVAAVSDDDPVVERVERDDDLIATMIDAAGRFWHDHVLTDVEPPLTWLDRDALSRAYPAVTEPDPVIGDAMLDGWIASRAALAGQIKQMEQQKALAEAEIIAALGEHDTLLIDGRIAATRKAQVSRVVDMDALAAVLDDAGDSLDNYRIERESRVLRIPDPAKRKEWKA